MDSRISYKELKRPILEALERDSPQSYNYLYEITKSREKCSKKFGLCTYYYTGKCNSPEKRSCEFFKLVTCSQTTFSRCINYLDFNGDITRRRINSPIGIENALFFKTNSSYIHKYNDLILAKQYALRCHLTEIEFESPYGFEANHYKEIITTILYLLKKLIIALYDYSYEPDKVSLLYQYKSSIRAQVDTGYRNLRLLVKSPLQMSPETCRLIVAAFSLGYSKTLRDAEFVCLALRGELDYVTDYERDILLSESGDLEDDDVTHFSIIWEHINSLLGNLIRQLFEYSNADSQRIAFNADSQRIALIQYREYRDFLKTQLSPSLIDLCKLVQSPSQMSFETFNLLDELLDRTASAVYTDVKHPLNTITAEEHDMIWTICNDTKTTQHPHRREFSHFDPQCVTAGLETNKMLDKCLNELRANSARGINSGQIKWLVAQKRKGFSTSSIAKTLGISDRRVQQIYREYCKKGST